MSSSENEEVSHSNRHSPEQVNIQCDAVLQSLERVGNLIYEFQELEISEDQIQNQVSKPQTATKSTLSLVGSKIAFFESKSTDNIPSSPIHFLSGLPLYPKQPQQRQGTASLPVSPSRIEVSHRIPISANMSSTGLALPNATGHGADLNNSLELVQPPPREDDDQDSQGHPPEKSRFEKFAMRLGVSIATIKNNVQVNKIKLSNEQLNQLDVANMKSEAKQYASDLEVYVQEYHALANEEEVEVSELNDVNNIITDTQKVIRDLVNHLEIAYPTEPVPAPPPQPTPPDNNSIVSIMGALQGVTNSPLVKLPTFAGEVAQYNGFKASFKFHITQIMGPKTMWATHLVNSLKGEAKKYVGEATDWFDQYDELWESLDSKYANRWLLATETIRKFFGRPPPKDNLQAVKDFFFDQMQALNNLLALKMELEHIGVNHIIENLPERYRSQLQNGLRVLQPGQNNANFSRKTAKNVFNDTIGIQKAQPAPLKSTLTLQAQTADPEDPSATSGAQPQPPQVQSQNAQTFQQSRGNFRGRGRGRGRGSFQQSYHSQPPRQDNYNNRGSGYSRGSGYYRGSGYHRGSHSNGGSLPQPVRKCTLCGDDNENSHLTYMCDKYSTVSQKWERLLELNHCPRCARPEHNGDCMHTTRPCHFHPNEFHYTFLCPSLRNDNQNGGSAA